jgi:hypothetical protein
MRPLWLVALAVAALGAAAGVGGCFNPDKPACAFSCAEAPHTCPAGFVCGADNLCHDPTSTGACGITFGDAAITDAGEDAPARDAAADTASDAAEVRADVRIDSPPGG